MNTQQMDFWKGEFGGEYTERNTFSPTQLDELYISEYGISRTDMNSWFLSNLTIESILEVGCNVGNQLQILQKMGFESLYGIELQWYAVEKAKELTKGINILQGSAFSLPFKNSYFDLSYTSGVLIHISPDDINSALDEIHRVSNKYIWGFEYFSEQYIDLKYRGSDEKMWKTNFKQLLLDRFPDLRLVKHEKYKYIQDDNVDEMYLLEKIKI